MRKYKEVKSILTDVTGTKFCLSESEVKRGLTLEKKRDTMCPSFSRWDSLFGERMNLNPVGVLEAGDHSDDSIAEDTAEAEDINETVVIGPSTVLPLASMRTESLIESSKSHWRTILSDNFGIRLEMKRMCSSNFESHNNPKYK